MIIDNTVKVHIVNSNAKHYQDHGYTFNLPNDYIDVKIADLSLGSHVCVNTKCDICGKQTRTVYKDYVKLTNNHTRPYYCEKCKYAVIRQNYLDQYGVPSNLCFEETKEQIKQTCKARYGVEYAAQLQIFKDKAKQTNIKKYGVENPFEAESIKEKIRQTNFKRYGCAYPAQNPEVVAKARNTCYERYGVYNAMQNAEIHSKARATQFNQGTVETSKQQKYLCKLFGGILNYPWKWYNLDIYLEDEHLDIEYNGGGHDLCVRLGTSTVAEFSHRAIVRSARLKLDGIKEMTISSTKDYLPSDDVLNHMLDYARNYFREFTDASWIKFDIDAGIVSNSQHREGIPYDFGKLQLLPRTYSMIGD